MSNVTYADNGKIKFTHYPNPLGLPLEIITNMTPEEIQKADEDLSRQLFDLGGKAKPIKYAYPVKTLRERKTVFEPLLTFI